MDHPLGSELDFDITGIGLLRPAMQQLGTQFLLLSAAIQIYCNGSVILPCLFLFKFISASVETR